MTLTKVFGILEFNKNRLLKVENLYGSEGPNKAWRTEEEANEFLLSANQLDLLSFGMVIEIPDDECTDVSKYVLVDRKGKAISTSN